MLNRHIKVSLAKNTKEDDSNGLPVISEEAIKRVSRDIVNRIAVGAIAVIGAAVVLKTIGDVVTNSIDNHQKHDKD